MTLALLLAGCASEPPAAPAQTGTEAAAALADRLRDYVYAAYEVERERASPAAKVEEKALGALREAGTRLREEMQRDGLAAPEKDKEPALPDLVKPLAAYFAAHSDLVVLPLPEDVPGVALARVAERREVRERALAGRTASYRVVLFDEMPVEDLERWKAHGASPRGSVASFSGTTIYLDRALARRIAREVVLKQVDAVRALGPKAAAGKASRAELKNVLRFAALDEAIKKGEDAITAAILDAEETRVAALIACLSELPSERTPDAAQDARVARDAVLTAIVAGGPRYQLAGALSTILAAPGSPPANGAEQALAAVSGTRDEAAQGPALLRLKVDEMRARAAAALEKK